MAELPKDDAFGSLGFLLFQQCISIAWKGVQRMDTKTRTYIMLAISCLIVIASMIVGGGCGHDNGTPSPVYSNATLTGTWMVYDLGPDAISTSMKFDGNGSMVEYYELNIDPDLPYPYNVQANGTFTILIGAPASTITGMLTSATTGVFTPVAGTFKKVMDLGACEGTWSGTLSGSHSESFTIDVDKTGTITGGGGELTTPYGGKLFCESGHATGIFTTGEADELGRIMFHTGTVVSGATVTISGDYETNNGNGQYTLVK
jgi:hypothetical protein